LRLQREVFRFAQGNFFVLAIKIIEFYFVFLSTFRNFALAARSFSLCSRKLLRLGKKIIEIYFVLLSTFRNFASTFLL